MSFLLTTSDGGSFLKVGGHKPKPNTKQAYSTFRSHTNRMLLKVGGPGPPAFSTLANNLNLLTVQLSALGFVDFCYLLRKEN